VKKARKEEPERGTKYLFPGSMGTGSVTQWPRSIGKQEERLQAERIAKKAGKRRKPLNPTDNAAEAATREGNSE